MDVDSEPEIEEAKDVGTREFKPPDVSPPAGPSEPKKRRRPRSEAERLGSDGNVEPSMLYKERRRASAPPTPGPAPPPSPLRATPPEQALRPAAVATAALISNTAARSQS